MWSREEKNIHAAIILGSQVRDEFKGDEWSDLDVLLLVDNPQVFLQTDTWLAFLGEIVCVIVEETNLDWVHLTWSVKRVLFTDNRTMQELLARTADTFALIIQPYEDVTSRLPPKTGTWAQWEVIWQKK